MNVRRYLWLIAALVLLAGCGGSGSSGFDDFTENAAIEQALANNACVERMPLTICAADAPPAPGAPGRVETGLDAATPLTCTLGFSDDICQFSLPFVPQGFPPTATFRVAVRTVDPLGKWIIGEATQPLPTATPGMEAPVDVQPPGRDSLSESRIQLAVLVFIEPPAMVPTEVDELADSGADFAFVTTQLTLLAAMGPDL